MGTNEFKKVLVSTTTLICLCSVYSIVLLNVMILHFGDPLITMQKLMNLKPMYPTIAM